MRVVHPWAESDVGAAPSMVDVRGDRVPVRDDGTFEIGDDQTSWLQSFAAAHGVDPDDLVAGATGEGESTDAGNAPLEGDPESMLEAGECPWCSDYDGDAVAQHAASAHPEQWDAYKGGVEDGDEDEDEDAAEENEG